MLEYRQNWLQMDPLRLNITSSLTEDFKSQEFRRVICQGVFDDQRSIYVGPRSRSISGVTENGYYVITPLMPIPNNPQRYVILEPFCFFKLITAQINGMRSISLGISIIAFVSSNHTDYSSYTWSCW